MHTGLHAVADLEEVGAEEVFREAHARGVELMPLSAYSFGRSPARAKRRADDVDRGLVLGFGSVRPDAIARGMARLAEAIDAVRRGSRASGGAAAR